MAKYLTISVDKLLENIESYRELSEQHNFIEFNDSYNIPKEYKFYLGYASGYTGLLKGDENNNFRGNDFLTRAEMAHVLNRIIYRQNTVRAQEQGQDFYYVEYTGYSRIKHIFGGRLYRYETRQPYDVTVHVEEDLDIVPIELYDIHWIDWHGGPIGLFLDASNDPVFEITSVTQSEGRYNIDIKDYQGNTSQIVTDENLTLYGELKVGNHIQYLRNNEYIKVISVVPFELRGEFK